MNKYEGVRRNKRRNSIKFLFAVDGALILTFDVQRLQVCLQQIEHIQWYFLEPISAHIQRNQIIQKSKTVDGDGAQSIASQPKLQQTMQMLKRIPFDAFQLIVRNV